MSVTHWLKKRDIKETAPKSIFYKFINTDIIGMLLAETNKYFQQYIMIVGRSEQLQWEIT